MTSHDNVHIPKESWPQFSWVLIEFALVMAVALVIACQTSPGFEDYVFSYWWDCEQVSQETQCNVEEEKSTTGYVPYKTNDPYKLEHNNNIQEISRICKNVQE